jgi:hypothetical protein
LKQDDFKDYIENLQNKQFVTSRRPSLIVNNFYSLITIVIISIAIIIYTNYIIPIQQAHLKKTAQYEKKLNNN